MNTAGIIAEYNPFHNGHIYNIEKAKEKTGADYTIVIMSGNFVQRGEAAITDKWKRAEAAVNNGADLVIELPFVYASQTAEIFSSGAVKILDSLNVCSFLAFGSEAEDLEELKKVSEILAEEPDDYRELIRSLLKKGISFPEAREKALREKIGEAAYAVSHPNNILAAEYMKTLMKLKSSMTPVNIKRTTDYSSEEIVGNFASATAVRTEIIKIADRLNSEKTQKTDSFIDTLKMSPSGHTIPKDTFRGITEFYRDNKGFIKNTDIFSVFLSDFIRFGTEENIFDMDKDTINRIENIISGKIKISSDSEHLSSENIMKEIKTKNYTQTRINRAILNSVFKITDSDMEEFKNHIPGYIRILGTNKNGFKIINEIKKNSDIEIINRFSDIKKLKGTDRKMLEIEKTATDMYFYLLSKYSGEIIYNTDYKKSPYIKK